MDYSNIDVIIEGEKGKEIDICFHYTDIRALKNILETKQLRLMHYYGMNDKSEGKYYIDYLKSDEQISIEEYLALKDRLKYLYLSCFSKEPNLLSQWRAYGNICIGFDENYIRENRFIIENKKGRTLETSGLEFTDCEYIDEHDLGAVTSDINELRSIGDINILVLGLLSFAFSLKHIGFSEEKEKRLFAYAWKRDPFFNDEMKPFIIYPIEAAVIRKIIVGPSNIEDELVNRLKLYLESNTEYFHVELSKSTIPFR